MTQEQFYADAYFFLDALSIDFASNGVHLSSHWDIDHICYRAQSAASYEELKLSFANFGSLLIESEVNGRLISTYKLSKPLRFKNREIDLVELPAPKPGKAIAQGFEHIEIVCDETFPELMEKYSHLKFETKGLSKAFNRELEISLGARNIKFHHSSLNSVITVEKNQSIWSALVSSNILNILEVYDPLVAGTFPLGLETSQSDLDILVFSDNLVTMEKLLAQHFGDCDQFKLSRETVDDLATLICQFEFQSVPFEVFVQNKPTVKQTAYRHFQIEERLLKKGGESFRNAVMKERLAGLKTEPAFAKVLGLQGDPYLELLKL